MYRRIGNFVEMDVSLWGYLNPCFSYLGHNVWSVHYTDQQGKLASEMFNDKEAARRLFRHIQKKGIFAHP
jgi:hypothetical protein